MKELLGRLSITIGRETMHPIYSKLLITEKTGLQWSVKRMSKVIHFLLFKILRKKKLLFLGTENGLWVSINEGQDWVQVKNGFPSVSTMDLKIQEKESALVIGTFGRAIWVLDDLLSLRDIITKNSDQKLIPLSLNKVVQVKGLFIAPPGNIWTGFHTTFEGKNRVFQKVRIPFFLNDKPTALDSVTAFIQNSKMQTINTVVEKNLEKGLNYITWKLDEKTTTLPGSWINEESRGIPVLPGKYKAKIRYQDQTKTTSIEVVADPRFEIEDEVDQALYVFQKQVDKQVKRLTFLLQELDGIEQTIKDSSASKKSELKNKGLLAELKSIQLMGRDKPVDRQVGAWQSSKITPHALMRSAVKVSKARLSIPSDQDWKLLKQAELLINTFEKEVERFKSKWKL